MLRSLLCELGDVIRDAVIAAKTSSSIEALSGVSAVCEADTIYSIDRFSEEAILEWLERRWPEEEPVSLVMEGIEDHCAPVFPKAAQKPKWCLVIDPIDGTRGIMYDKRSAWALAGLAPLREGSASKLSEIEIAAMTEIPVTKQWRADQISCSPAEGIVAVSHHVLTGETAPLRIQPSRAADFAHGFSSLVKFFPEGRAFTAEIEEALWAEILGAAPKPSPLIFDDQYISTGGQFYELLIGHDRMIADLRPWVFSQLGMESELVCHPYDACVWPVLRHAGVVFQGVDGGFPDAPIDTTSPVAWIAFANEVLAAQAGPVLRKILKQKGKG